jgi:2-hydroxychromene-2-carboxylate isomerase
MIEFFFDCSSPWTWLAFHNIQPLARELGVAIQWRPILLGAVFDAVNPTVYAFREGGAPVKQRHVEKDLQDWARHSGLTIRFPNAVFPLRSTKVMRGCLLLEPEGKLVAFASAAFEAYWTHEQDLSRDDALVALCQSVDVDPDRFLQGIATPEIKARLRANTDELIRRGGFGSPTMFVAGEDMYFGNDRLVLVRAAVEKVRSAIRIDAAHRLARGTD